MISNKFPVLIRACWFSLNHHFSKKISALPITTVQYTVLRNLYDFSEKKIGYLFNALNEGLKTDVFNNLSYNEQLSFSFCNNKDDKLKYIDCFYITEYIAPNNKDAIEVYSQIEKIQNTTIYYKPTRNWDWLINQDKIYFISSVIYSPNSPEFKSVVKIIKDVYEIE